MRAGARQLRRVLGGCGLLAIAVTVAGLATGNILLADAGTVAVLVILAAWLLTSGAQQVAMLVDDRRARSAGARGAGRLRRVLARAWLLVIGLLLVACLRLVAYVVN